MMNLQLSQSADVECRSVRCSLSEWTQFMYKQEEDGEAEGILSHLYA